MLFSSAQCRRSTDDAHISWQKGRQEPATFPRVTYLRIVSDLFPWMFTIHATKKAIGVTCGEVIDTLAESFSLLSSKKDYDALVPRRRNKVSEAYTHNRSTAYGVPGGTLGQGMRRLDFLCKDTMFGGLVADEVLLRKLCGELLPGTFVLRCMRRYALTQDEIRDQEVRNGAEGERRRPRATVMTDSDDDD